MAVVWFSHLGETPIQGVGKEEIQGKKISEVISNIENSHPGFKNIIFSGTDETIFNISTRVVFQPMVGTDSNDVEALFYGAETQFVESPDDPRPIGSNDQLLFSILNPDR